MSGSGATCFGLYETSDDAASAAAGLAAAHSAWWIAAGELL
jgi:4-diphosphocytidyl-2-C-methyl-D-erythritol kinase